MQKIKFFDINGRAPTEAAIRSQLLRRLPATTCIAALPALVVLALSNAAAVPLDFNVGFLEFGMALIGLCHLGAVLNSLRPISPMLYPELWEACSSSQEGMAYRSQVLLQGRRFVGAELAMLHTWNAMLPVRKACRAMYEQD